MDVADKLVLWEILLRGGAASLSLVSAVMLLGLAKPRPIAAVLGGLFGLTNAGYAIVSSPLIDRSVVTIAGPLWITAVYNGAFFWWFATALFDDAWRWTAWRIAPAVFLGFAFLTYVFLEGPLQDVVSVAHNLLVGAFVAHVVVLAARDFRDDMVDLRRRFRIAFIATAAPIAVGVTIAELYADLVGDVASWLSVIHALALFAATFVFASWVLKAQSSLFAPPVPKTAATEHAAVAPADRPTLARLEAAMEAGAWRESGLAIAALAERTGAPEHHLRRIINGGLGARNFSAFLAGYRIEEAKRRLSDPAEARTQVLQIALDVGYGSVGPFNRAFKDATGETPTEYRRKALEGG
ncbi:MAG: AraC family transcriptional regulator [Pseudomonadota bacterium]